MNSPITAIDKSIDFGNLDKYGLNLLIHENQFVSSIYKQKGDIILGVTETPIKVVADTTFNLKDFVDKVKGAKLKISKKYKSIHLSIVNNCFTLIPSELFDKKQLEDYLKLASSNSLEYVPHYNKIEQLGLYIIFGTPKKLSSWLGKNFPKSKLKHHLAIVLESLYKDFGISKTDKVFIHASKDKFDLVGYRKGKLAIVNTYEFQNEEDFLYYVLFAFEQAGFDPNSVETVLLGELDKNSAIFETLYNYIRNIGFGERKNQKLIGPSLQQIPSNYFYVNFNQHLCV